MNREEYIKGLEEIRDTVRGLILAFLPVCMDEPTEMERERRKKTHKLIGDLYDRLFEDIAISEKIAADNKANGVPEQGNLFEATTEDDNNLPPALPTPDTNEAIDGEEVEA